MDCFRSSAVRSAHRRPTLVTILCVRYNRSSCPLRACLASSGTTRRPSCLALHHRLVHPDLPGTDQRGLTNDRVSNLRPLRKRGHVFVWNSVHEGPFLLPEVQTIRVQLSRRRVRGKGPITISCNATASRRSTRASPIRSHRSKESVE